MKRDKPIVLVVDDTPEILDVLSALLEPKYQVKVALNGNTALKIANRDPSPDLILLDVNMPDPNGLEVCKILKNSLQTADIPVIFVTVMDETESEVSGLYSGAVDYITKPFVPEVVLARVHTHLSLARANRQLKENNQKLEDAIQLQQDMDVIMRHDLKGPLSAVIGFPEILMEKYPLEDYARMTLESIRDSGQDLLNMINMSIDLLKLERGLYQIKIDEVKLGKVISRVASGFTSLINGKKLNLSIDYRNADSGGDRVEIPGEEMLVYSVISNLLKNAIEAAPAQSSIEIEIEIEDGEALSVRLTNQGEVPESIRDQFFNKYVTAGKNDGTGLGTYSAKLMLDALGATIKLDTSQSGMTMVIVNFQYLDFPSK